MVSTLPLFGAGSNDQLESARHTPAWVATSFAQKDPYADSWKPHAAALKKFPNYAEGTAYAAQARRLIEALDKNSATPAKLYEASAAYIVARSIDWQFEYDPLSSPLHGKLSSLLLKLKDEPKSAEFCRVAFSICALRPDFEPKSMPKALLAKFPNDRIVIRAIVAHERTKLKNLETATWTLSLAKKLPELPDRRPQDFISLYNAYEIRFWSTKSLEDAKGCRDALRKAYDSLPAGFQARIKGELDGVEKYIRENSPLE